MKKRVILLLSIYPIVSIAITFILIISFSMGLSNRQIDNNQFVEQITICFLPSYLNFIIIPFNLIFYIVKIMSARIKDTEKIFWVIFMFLFHVFIFPIMYFYFNQKLIKPE